MLNLVFAAAIGLGGTAGGGLVVQRSGDLTSLAFEKGESFHQTRAKVADGRAIDVAGTQLRLATWQERSRAGTKTFYAIAPNGRDVRRVAEALNTLKLRYEEFDPLQTIPTVSPELAATEHNEQYIVQFQTQPLPEYRDAIARAGGVVTYYLPYDAYLVRMDSHARGAVSQLPYVRWVGPYQPAYRLDPDLRKQMEKGKLPTQRYNVQVYHYGLEEKQTAAQWIEAIGGKIDELGEPGYVFQATLTPGQLRAALLMNEVFWIDKWVPMEMDMNIARDFGGANYIEGVAGYTGQGVRAQVRDGGLRTTHVAFQSPPTIIRSNTTNTSHGSSTYGIVFGDGTANPLGRGMMPDAQGIFLAGLTTGSTRYNETAALLQAPYFAVFESNSTGGTRTRAYTTDSFGMDDILFRMNITILQSQSNAGNQDSRPQAWAKNIVSIGGIKHLNTLTRADDRWTAGGSIGPAADGRIKPDLAHFYDSVLCTTNTNDTAYTSSFGGTSAATPITAGHFGLFYQMWADGVFGQTVTGTTVFDARPMNMTAKAVMINTATQWTFSGASADLTRTHQGWGAADLKAAYDQRNDMFIVDETDVLTNLQSKTYRLYVASGTPEFKATMVYSDPPGTTSSTLHRINDLTLKVTAPNGTVYWGNNGLLANNYSTPGGVANTVDTVENVFVASPQAGVWTIEVSGDAIVQDARLETAGVVDADYALAVSGVRHSVLVSSLQADVGTPQGGVLADLHTSNNHAMGWGQSAQYDSIVPHGRVTFRGTAPTSTLSQLTFRVEAKANATGTSMDTYLYNWTTNRYELVDSATLGGTDQVRTVTVTSNPSAYVNPATLQMAARLDMYRRVAANEVAWRVSTDQVRWFVHP
ncbi:MAG: S8 family serine peptidase [Fimbriimonadaceae bacterium]|nr:S8 family serine peptidase [Chthonomonadaceae bacterium]MCO5296548.1 S8 family serine peptidase [Fimbriimonadaceae bacterium]